MNINKEIKEYDMSNLSDLSIFNKQEVKIKDEEEGYKLLFKCENADIFKKLIYEYSCNPLYENCGYDLLFHHRYNIDIFKTLLAYGCDPLYKNEGHNLITLENIDLFELTIEIGCNPLYMKEGYYILYHCNNIIILDRLLELGCKPNNSIELLKTDNIDKFNKLLNIIEYTFGNNKGSYFLLKYHINNLEQFNKLIELNCSPLYEHEGYRMLLDCYTPEIFEKLIELNCNPLFRGDKGYKLILSKICSNDYDITKILLEYSNEKGEKCNPLHISKGRPLLDTSNLRIFKLLIKHNCEYELSDITTIEKAIIVNHPGLNKILKNNIDEVKEIVKNIGKRTQFEQELLLSNKIIRKYYQNNLIS